MRNRATDYLATNNIRSISGSYPAIFDEDRKWFKESMAAKVSAKAAQKVEVEPDLSHITARLQALAVPMASLILDPTNARKHSPKNLDAIEQFQGWRQELPPVWLHPEWSQRENPELLRAIVETVKTTPNTRAGYQLHKMFGADFQDKGTRPNVPLGGVSNGVSTEGVPLHSGSHGN